MRRHFPLHLPLAAQPWAWYLLLALSILGPLLLSGYILTLDLVFTPRFSLGHSVGNTLPLDALLWLINTVLPGDLLEKLVLLLILVLSGVGMHRFVELLMPRMARAPQYAAGIFYMVNPFIYDRLMAGHWRFLIGYALLPFFVRSLVLLLRRPRPQAALTAGLWAFAVTTASLHHSGIIAILVAVGLIIAMAFFRPALRRGAPSIALATSIWLLLSSFWLVPSLVGSSSISASLGAFTDNHFAAFATDGVGVIGRIGNVIRLQGFWAEAQGLFLLPQHIMPLWGILFIFCWVVLAAGGRMIWRYSRAQAIFVFTIFVLGVVLSTTDLILWMSRLFSPLAGFREPQKMVQLVALGYCVLFAYGVSYFTTRTKHIRRPLAAALLCLPLLITPTMLWGFAGQLRPVSYPSDWENVNSLLKANPTQPGHTALFLPWHQYAEFSFAGRIIANPAERYFEVPVIAGDNPEFADISPTVPDSYKAQIADALSSPDMARSLSVLGVEYVILAHEQDYQSLAPSFNTSARIVYQGDHLTLYQLERSSDQ